MNARDLANIKSFNYVKNAKDFIEISLKEKSKAELAIEIARMNPVYYRNMFGDYPLERFIDAIYADDASEIISLGKYENAHINGPAKVKIVKESVK